ncbi:hypothetical protein TNCT_441741 [Trichonephila clavata]|uniref:Uncharacterized protein n=1 Tax=Trichonephila clavata TaxID=2740835 RepID=A0A8X6KUR4_TRICU|nr:hypothetical protein TNCT_441741 [Trichonephila clavata]
MTTPGTNSLIDEKHLTPKRTRYTDRLQRIELHAQTKKGLSQINEPSSAHSQDTITETRPGITPPEPKMDWSTENEQPPEPPWNNNPTEMLLKDPRLTKEYTDPCQKHQDYETLLAEIVQRREFLATIIRQVQEGHTSWDMNFIAQRQKDIEDLHRTFQCALGKLALSYPCPNTNCENHLQDGEEFARKLTDAVEVYPPFQINKVSKKKTDKEGFTSPSKTKRVKLTDHPNFSTDNPIPIANKFDALATMDTDPSITTEEQIPTPKIPPIMLKYEANYSNLTADLLSNYPELTFKLAGDFLKIFTSNPENYSQITTYLKEKGHQYYDFPPPSLPPQKNRNKRTPDIY